MFPPLSRSCRILFWCWVTIPLSRLMRVWASVSCWLVMFVWQCMVVMRLYTTVHAVLLRSSPSLAIWRIVSAIPGNIGGCSPLALTQKGSGRGEATSCTDGVGDDGTYWMDGDEDETEMWHSCWVLNSSRS